MKNLVIGVGGSGAMGTGIAQVAALAGHKVILLDTNTGVLEKAKSAIHQSLTRLVEKSKIPASKLTECLDAVNFTTSSEDFSSCHLVIEAIVENLEVKKEFFRKIEAVVNDECILATNTSSLPVISIASACRNKERVIGIHFFNPPFLMPLVEIVPSHLTDDAITRKATEIISSWGKVTVIAKDTPGFIVNRVARPYYGEALRIYEEGIAGFATIDEAMKTTGNFKMGPFELMDFIGNDINYKVTETVWEQFFYDPRYRPSLTQKRLYEAGLFGRKSGRGYYDYAADAQMLLPDKNPALFQEIFDRVIAMLINEAADALYLGIASKDHIELAMTKGVNYPKGLLRWCDEIGIESVLGKLMQLQSDYGEDRYRPSILLKKMSKEKRKFFE